jgi:hypothetical protein
VRHKRAVRAAAAAAAQQQQHKQIYHSAVKYHSTAAEHVPSIVEHGLLNQEDRLKIFDEKTESRMGMSRQLRDSPYQGDERKGVFLAVMHLL